jgi:hypothetical protein
VQAPPWHVSPVVHALLSLHAVPLGLFWAALQTPAVQTTCWHWFAGCGQSPLVVHVTQPVIGVKTHVFVVWLQVSVVHGLLSLHCASVVQQPGMSV